MLVKQKSQGKALCFILLSIRGQSLVAAFYCSYKFLFSIKWGIVLFQLHVPFLAFGLKMLSSVDSEELGQFTFQVENQTNFCYTT